MLRRELGVPLVVELSKFLDEKEPHQLLEHRNVISPVISSDFRAN